MRRRGQGFPDEKSENTEEKDDEKRKPGDVEHHRNHAEGKRVLRIFFDGIGKFFLQFIAHAFLIQNSRFGISAFNFEF